MTDIVERLRGVYRVAITDGLGPVGGREPNNPIEFVRKFETPPIQREAADEIERLRTVADARLTLCNAYLTRADRAERERDEARALVGNETTLLGIITDIRRTSRLGAKPMLSELAEEIGKIRRERDEARARALEEAAQEIEATAAILDRPSIYMGGASPMARRTAKTQADAIRALVKRETGQ